MNPRAVVAFALAGLALVLLVLVAAAHGLLARVCGGEE